MRKSCCTHQRSASKNGAIGSAVIPALNMLVFKVDVGRNVDKTFAHLLRFQDNLN